MGKKFERPSGLSVDDRSEIGGRGCYFLAMKVYSRFLGLFIEPDDGTYLHR